MMNNTGRNTKENKLKLINSTHNDVFLIYIIGFLHNIFKTLKCPE
jgi:hypothetical protein